MNTCLQVVISNAHSVKVAMVISFQHSCFTYVAVMHAGCPARIYCSWTVEVPPEKEKNIIDECSNKQPASKLQKLKNKIWSAQNLTFF